MLLQGYRTDVKTSECVQQIYLWNQSKSMNTANRQRAKQFWDNSNPRWLTGTPEVGLPLAFHCYFFCARKSTTLAFASAFGLLLFMPFGNKTSNWWIFNFFVVFCFEIPLQICGWFSFVLAEHMCTKLFFSLVTPSCDCSAANRSRLKSADT